MPERKKKRKLNWLRVFIVLAALGVFLGGGLAFGMVLVSLKDLPSWDPAALQPNNATLIYDANDNLLTEVGLEHRIPVDIKDIPADVKKAFLAAEDHRFYQHYGIDFRALARAAWANLTGSFGEQGGSTITQQLAKNVFLSEEKRIQRKIQEAFLAIQIERHYTKEEILGMYLNWVYFGEGAHGIESAARTYFAKSASQLELHEAALLAGLLQAPSHYSPYRDEEAAVRRRNTILDLMHSYGFIDAAAADEAKARPLELGVPAGNNDGGSYPHPHFVDYVIDVLVDKYGETRVFKEGLRVYTTIDPKVQQAAEEALANEENFPVTTRDDRGLLQPQAAMVIIDPSTGHIRALVGGREPGPQRQWNRATRTQPQPGSAFKPIIAYGPAIEYLGMGPATVFDDIPVEYPNWQPKNYDGSYRGLITMREALVHSVNIPAVKTLEAVSPSRAVDFATKLGITTLEPDRHNLAIALGGLTNGVTPLQMAGAYAAFANQGIYIEPTAITRVEDCRGQLLEEHVPVKTQAMQATTAYLITDMLRNAVTSGTGTRARLPDNRPVAGKTGTTDNHTSVWFCGYTPDLVGVVWIGYDDQTKSLPAGSTGGAWAAPIWRQVMARALEGVPPRPFVQPAGLVAATVDSKSGFLPGPLTPEEHMVTDLFVRGTVPNKVDNTHVLVEICPATGLLAGEYCPDRVTKVMVDLGYSVPSYVRDYNIRVPTETCDLHVRQAFIDPLPPGFWLPDDENGADDEPNDNGDDEDHPGNNERGRRNNEDRWLMQ